MSPRHSLPLVIALAASSVSAQELRPSPLPPLAAGLPDVLTQSDGTPVTTRQAWLTERAPALRALVQTYEYGFMPPKPAGFSTEILRIEPAAFGGKATLKEVLVRCEKPDALVHLMVVVPNAARTAHKPAPCFLGMAFSGNYALLNDPLVHMPASWTPADVTPVVRGKDVETWNLEKIIDRGYAVATFFNGDVVPDKLEVARERLKGFVPPGKSPEDADAPATIAAWAWGFSRMIDYLSSDAEIDGARIAVVGHSRNGKTALLAAVMDERVALVIPSQAGCGGTAPVRMAPELAVLNARGRPSAETVAVINTNFPHWFCGNFKSFNTTFEKLPFDQHAMIALCAPRPVLISTATEDQWSNPAGQLDMLRAADPVYRLLSGEGIDPKAQPQVGTLINSRLGYFSRAGKHSMNAEDWAAWLDYADQWLK